MFGEVMGKSLVSCFFETQCSLSLCCARVRVNRGRDQVVEPPVADNNPLAHVISDPPRRVCAAPLAAGLRDFCSCFLLKM